MSKIMKILAKRGGEVRLVGVQKYVVEEEEENKAVEKIGKASKVISTVLASFRLSLPPLLLSLPLHYC